MATYYIDPQNGNNNNSGLSENEAVQTNKILSVCPGDKVLFKRGSLIRDDFYNVFGKEGNPVYYGAYGEGKLPTFTGAQSLADEKYWKEELPNIWVCTAYPNDEACNIVFDDSTAYGTLRWTKEELKEQGDFYNNVFGYGNSFKPITDSKIYLYSTKNPAKYYSHIECVMYKNKQIVVNGNDMIFENIRFLNCAFALASDKKCKNVTVKNCVFENIGGQVWNYEKKIRFGNAIEAWNVAENLEVTGCYFDNIYDSAVTHQGGPDVESATFRFNNNVFLRCGMGAFEQRDIMPKHAEFNNNICAYAGEGFSKLGEEMPRYSEIWPDPMGHHVFLWRIDSPTDGGCMQIKNNIFGDAMYGTSIYSIISIEAEAQIDFDNNTYCGKKYELMGRLGGVNYKTFEEYKKAEKSCTYKELDIEKEIELWKKKNNMEF